MSEIKWTIARKDSTTVTHKTVIDTKTVEIESAIHRPYVVTITSRNGETAKTEYQRKVLRVELQKYLVSTIKYPNSYHQLAVPNF